MNIDNDGRRFILHLFLRSRTFDQPPLPWNGFTPKTLTKPEEVLSWVLLLLLLRMILLEDFRGDMSLESFLNLFRRGPHLLV